jgi:transcriptional repressor NrdR
MKCPFCGFLEDKVVDSRESKEAESIRRRRECLKCGKRFTTYERIDEIPYMVVKKDGRREKFDRQKVLNGLLRACEKRPVPISKLEQIVNEAESFVIESAERERKTSEVGELIMSRLRRYDVGRWAADFIGDLLLLDPGRKGSLPKLLGPFGVRKLLDDYRRSLNRLLLFDYDGTLVPFASHPQLARPDRRLLKILHQLGANPRNELVLLSGRDKATLEDWFGSLPIGLVAGYYRGWLDAVVALLWDRWRSTGAVMDDRDGVAVPPRNNLRGSGHAEATTY